MHSRTERFSYSPGNVYLKNKRTKKYHIPDRARRFTEEVQNGFKRFVEYSVRVDTTWCGTLDFSWHGDFEVTDELEEEKLCRHCLKAVAKARADEQAPSDIYY